MFLRDKVPEHQVGQAAINEIRRFGVDTTRVLRGGGRVGIYYFEKGTNIRPTSVVYDRAYSAIAMAEAEEFDWEKLLEGVDLFYFSGITPAISCEIEKTLESALMLCKEKKSRWYVISTTAEKCGQQRTHSASCAV